MRGEADEEVLERMKYVKSRTRVPYKQLCTVMGVPYPSFKRWHGRKIRRDSIISVPGPKKTEPFDAERTFVEAACLDHRQHRSHGTGRLYAKYARQISRRDLARIVQEARDELCETKRRAMVRVTWRPVPNLVWSTDGTLFGPSEEGSPLNILNTYDLGCKYTLEPLGTAWEPCGEEVGGYLQHLFCRHGAPLFLKKDLGSNLNSAAVREVLAENWVIPLDSPPEYPQYNGSEENDNGLLKKAVLEGLSPYDTCPERYFPLYVRDGAARLNHRPRRVLRGQIPCQVYHGNKGLLKFSIPERRAIYDWIIDLTNYILENGFFDTQSRVHLAHRKAIELWLQFNGFIKTEVDGLNVTLF